MSERINDPVLAEHMAYARDTRHTDCSRYMHIIIQGVNEKQRRYSMSNSAEIVDQDNGHIISAEQWAQIMQTQPPSDDFVRDNLSDKHSSLSIASYAGLLEKSVDDAWDSVIKLSECIDAVHNTSGEDETSFGALDGMVYLLKDYVDELAYEEHEAYFERHMTAEVEDDPIEYYMRGSAWDDLQELTNPSTTIKRLQSIVINRALDKIEKNLDTIGTLAPVLDDLRSGEAMHYRSSEHLEQEG